MRFSYNGDNIALVFQRYDVAIILVAHLQSPKTLYTSMNILCTVQLSNKRRMLHVDRLLMVAILYVCSEYHYANNL